MLQANVETGHVVIWCVYKVIFKQANLDMYLQLPNLLLKDLKFSGSLHF